MSGEKFKKCCSSSQLSGYFSDQGFVYYDEAYVLSEILSEDLMFENFYSIECRNIDKPIFFVKGQNIGAAASYGHIPDLAYIIMTEYGVIPKEEAIHVAHEVMHIVLCSEEYKVVMPTNNVRMMKYHHMINDMIYDPILNKRLLDYKFNIENYLKVGDELQIRTIGTNNLNPSDYFFMTTLYVKKILDYRNINPGIKNEEIPFIVWLNNNYPQIKTEGEEMMSMVEAIGINTPEQCEQVFRNILQKYNIQNDFKIVSI